MLGARSGLGTAGDTSSGCGPVHFAQLVGFSEVRIGRGDALGTQFWNEPQSQPRPPFCIHPSLSGLLGGA